MDLNVINNNVAVESRRRQVNKRERVHSLPCTLHAVHGAAWDRHQVDAVVTTAVVTCECVHRHPGLLESTTSCRGRRTAKSQHV